MRLFFAVWPPAAAARTLASWAAQVHGDTGGRAVAEANIHLTLAFLGDADPDRAVQAARRVEGSRFVLPVNTARYWKHNQIVWAGPHELPIQLNKLVEKLQLELFRDGFMLERRPYAAHITLLRKAAPPESLPDVPPVSWPVREFVLARSERDGSGSAYTIVERFALGA